ncbi:MAG: carbonic anhydrase [Bacteroidales bacterium]|nr:carbonic anhydrase [Bacteroidales bacterium]
MDKTEILNRLKAGNNNFVNNRLKANRQDSIRREELLEGQDPFAIILSCADSRVVPELIFDTGIGELFVVRVAGNIANTSSIASIEYAVAHLNAQVLAVLGHENCGAINAAMKGGNHGDNLSHLLSYLQPAISASKNEGANDIARTNAKLTVQELINRSAIIAKAAKSRNLVLLPAYYHLESGRVDFLNL